MPAGLELKIAVVIPARYDSQRLPGKPLVDLGGRGGDGIALQVDLDAAEGFLDLGVADGADVGFGIGGDIHGYFEIIGSDGEGINAWLGQRRLAA